MPLHMLIALVVFGIAGITGLTLLLGLGRPRRFASDAEAAAAFAREYPDVDVIKVTRATDGSAALLDTSEGPALVWPMGADSAARLLTGVRASRSTQGLTLRLPDVTAPRIFLRLPDPEAEAWQQTLKATP